jgi:hypothetical protein
VAASAPASFDKDDKEMGAGFCLDHKTTGAICLAGSSLAEKMPAAFETCFGGEEVAAGRRRGNGGGRGKGGKRGPRCPSFDKIMSKVEEKFAGEACVLKQLGWIDEEGNDLKDTIMADIATLNEGVQAGLSDNTEECVGKIMEEMDGKYAKCADKYTDEEKATLEEVGVKIASYMCFMGQFKDACGSFIKSEYVEPLVASLTGPAGK